MLSLGKPGAQAPTEKFETTNKLTLPDDYKVLIKYHNGISLAGTEVYGIGTELYDLQQCYQFEHYQVNNPMPHYLIPFSPDGAGNHYCFDTRFNDGTGCPVVFWQHDYLYNDNDPPEVVNSNLVQWINEVMIEWTLENYNYNGTRK